MKNIIKISKKLAIAGLATIATLSMAIALTATPAAAEGEAAFERQQYKSYDYYGHKFRSHKKHKKHKKRSKRIKRYNSAVHYYGGKTYKHPRKRASHLTAYPIQ